MASVELECIERFPVADEIGRLQCHVLVLQFRPVLACRLDGTLKVALYKGLAIEFDIKKF